MTKTTNAIEQALAADKQLKESVLVFARNLSDMIASEMAPNVIGNRLASGIALNMAPNGDFIVNFYTGGMLLTLNGQRRLSPIVGANGVPKIAEAESKNDAIIAS